MLSDLKMGMLPPQDHPYNGLFQLAQLQLLDPTEPHLFQLRLRAFSVGLTVLDWLKCWQAEIRWWQASQGLQAGSQWALC
jgi:hypothetical protein